MSCRFGHDDAAYVLGALSPGERLQFERHLPGCEDCTRAVREVAGLPGLLSRIDPDVLTAMQVEPVPDTVLPGLLRAVRRSRRRRLLATAGTAAAAAALVTGGVVSQLPLGGAETPEGTDPPVAVHLAHQAPAQLDRLQPGSERLGEHAFEHALEALLELLETHEVNRTATGPTRVDGPHPVALAAHRTLRCPGCPSGEWRNRQTRWLQVPVRETSWGFKSPLAHQPVLSWTPDVLRRRVFCVSGRCRRLSYQQRGSHGGPER